MRSVPVLALILAAVAPGAPAEASCAPPEPVAQRIARADAVVLGRVVSFSGGLGPERRALIVAVERVYKGDVPAQMMVAIGPGGEGAGAPAATSVDYRAEAGTRHTFYLRQHGAAGFSTDACSGSHPGDLEPDERAALGGGAAPRAQGAAFEPGSPPRWPTHSDRALAAALLLAALGATFAASRAVLARRA